MAKELVTDELWEVIEPLLPEEPAKPKGGRPRIDGPQALTGIIFVLKSGIPWEMLPQEMGCGSGMTCWRRLKEWQEAGVWERLRRKLLDRLAEEGQIDWSRSRSTRRALRLPGGEKTGPNPTDRGKSGSKRHLFGRPWRGPLRACLVKVRVKPFGVFWSTRRTCLWLSLC
jgi:transposase